MKTPHLQAESEPQYYWPTSFLQPPEPPLIIAPMTVGIAAVCENGQAVVTAADRLVGTSIVGIEIDGVHQKLMKLTPHVLLASTGTIQDCEYVREKLRHSASLLGGMSGMRVAEKLRRSCEKIRARQIEQKIVRPLLDMSYAEFSKICATNNSTPFTLNVWEQVRAYRFELELLIAGVEESSAFVFRILSDAVHSFAGAAGFTSIGSGGVMASVELARCQQNPSLSLVQTLFNVYSAKRAAEAVSGVGSATDMALIRRGSEIEDVSPELLAKLKAIYDNMPLRLLTAGDVSSISAGLTKLPSPKAAAGSKGNRRGR